MEPAFDLTAIRLLLRRGIESGRWTLEDLDHAAEGWNENLKRFRINNPNYPVREYRNPLRDVPDPPAVEAGPDPRDFKPAPDPAEEFPF